MRNYIQLFCISLLSLHTTFGMDSTKNPMVKINDWEDVSPYAGRFVAYLGLYGGYGFKLENSKIKFGKISKMPNTYSGWSRSGWSRERGYTITRVLKPGDGHSTCVLTYSMIEKLYLRLLIRDEFTRLQKAIEDEDAQLEHMTADCEKEYVMKLLQEEEKLLQEKEKN